MQENRPDLITVTKGSNKKLWIPLVIVAVLTVTFLIMVVLARGELNDYRNKLENIQNQLSSAENNLTDVTGKLTTVQQQLTSKDTELLAKQGELASTQLLLDLLRGQLESNQEQLTATQQQLAAGQNETDTLQAELTAAQTQLDAIRIEYQNVTAGYAYLANDPTYAEMESFLAADDTDLRTYNVATYNCQNFSADVIANAAKQKIRCAFVSIDYPDSGHAIVAFNTTDRGLIYIEPQSDEEVNLQVGGRYYQEIVARPGYHYNPPNYDDTVRRFLIIW